MKLCTCDIYIRGKGDVRGIEVWLSGANQAEARKAAQALFPDQKVASASNVKEKRK